MPAKHKIYTQKGDKGETSLIGGMRVPKYHQQIETYGTIDELSSFVGLIRDQDIDEGTKATLIKIQNRLFTAATQLAVAPIIFLNDNSLQLKRRISSFWKIK